jgi:hypothetical protein
VSQAPISKLGKQGNRYGVLDMETWTPRRPTSRVQNLRTGPISHAAGVIGNDGSC